MIRWNHFDKSAFDAAKKQKKPILLSISATWCHWCHTMDRLTYANEEIVRFINESFIPIRVDTDARPDINERYNVGGWPSTVILAHDGEPVSGATYVPPEHMIDFLEDAIRRFKEYKPHSHALAEEKEEAFDPAEFYSLVKSFYDPINGGFGLEPKFPNADLLQYLVWRIGRFGDKAAARMLDQTLQSMLDGELFDHIGGGFFRYATVQNWTIPHFEKMLDDNAKLLSVYVAGYRIFKKKEYLSAVNKTLFFLQTMLYDRETKLFSASQDADEAYCALPLDRRMKKRKPFVDAHKYADFNASVVVALLDASALEPKYKSFALSLLNRLYAQVMQDGVIHTPNEEPLYLLKDASNLLYALTRAYALTKKPELKERALKVAKSLGRFEDKNGGFFDIGKTKDSVGRLAVRRKQVNENALVAISLRALAKFTGETRFAKRADAALRAVSAQALMMGAYAALYALAVEQ